MKYDVYVSFTYFFFPKNICLGVWIKSCGLNHFTHIYTPHPRHHGPFTGHTVILSWLIYQSACWWKETSLL